MKENASFETENAVFNLQYHQSFSNLRFSYNLTILLNVNKMNIFWIYFHLKFT